MKRIVILEKIGEVESPKHEGGYPIGHIARGTLSKLPEVGERFIVGNTKHGDWFVTSDVTRLIDENTFETLNSIYKYRLI